MESVLKPNKLEELLIANWTNFIESNKLMAFVLSCVRENVRSNFSVIAQSVGTKKGVQITISRFQLTKDGFILWIDFNVPYESNIAVGTSEMLLSHTGTLNHIRTVGNLLNHV